MMHRSLLHLQSTRPLLDRDQPAEQTQACVANIDTAGRRQRLVAGLVEVVIGLGILAALLAFHANPLWRLPLLFVFWGAAVGFFQWRDRT